MKIPAKTPIIFFLVFFVVSSCVNYFKRPLSDTALFYTYSTIAQTLAASFGVLGAFLLYRLQTISIRMRDILNVNYELKGKSYKGYERFFLSEDYDALVKNLSSERGKEDIWVQEANKLNNYRKTMIKKATIAFCFTVPTILLSIILLPFIPILFKYAAISSVLLGTVMGLTALCIFLYAELVISSLEISKKERNRSEQGTTN